MGRLREYIQDYLSLLGLDPRVTQAEVGRVARRLEREGYLPEEVREVPDHIWDRIIEEELLW